MYEQRRLIQYWFDNYPESEQKELSSRVTSNDDVLFNSAFFEMFLYNLLCRLGCQIAIHPSTESDHNSTPDFLITTSTGEQFYLEAKVGTDQSKREASQERLVNELVDYINGFRCPDFLICLHIIDPPLIAIAKNNVRLCRCFFSRLHREYGLPWACLVSRICPMRRIAPWQSWILLRGLLSPSGATFG